MTANEVSKALRDLSRHGFFATKTPGGHYRITHPTMAEPVFAPSSPSDNRAVANMLAILRRKTGMPELGR